jgi:hypothetical protein
MFEDYALKQSVEESGSAAELRDKTK